MRILIPAAAAVVLIALTGTVPAAVAAPVAPGVIALPGATGAEGIAAGKQGTFYAGDRLDGDIYRGDVQDGTADPFIDAPDGRVAIGMAADVKNNLLFVAGGGTGDAYVYNTETGEEVAAFELTDAGFINDVTLTADGAWFTNSNVGELYFVPVAKDGTVGDFQVLDMSGPAGEAGPGFNLNGIATAPDGTLVVAHSSLGELYTVDPETGVSALIEGVSVPAVDGIEIRGGTLWAVQNSLDQISRIALAGDLSSGTLDGVITSPDFRTPTTAVLFGNTLAVVNAQFFYPTDTQFEVVLVRAR